MTCVHCGAGHLVEVLLLDHDTAVAVVCLSCGFPQPVVQDQEA